MKEAYARFDKRFGHSMATATDFPFNNLSPAAVTTKTAKGRIMAEEEPFTDDDDDDDEDEEDEEEEDEEEEEEEEEDEDDDDDGENSEEGDSVKSLGVSFSTIQFLLTRNYPLN
jgi:hypothetical protein